jgi:hypothetical protein
MKEDLLQQQHEDYLRQVSESGLPLWVLNEYSLPLPSVEERARVQKSTYYCVWSDNFSKRHTTIVEAIDMLDAMNFVDNEARQFGYETCNFISVSVYENDYDCHGDDLPF